MNKNPFDFTNTDDLPEKLAGRVASAAGSNPMIAIFADVVKAAADAGVMQLGISQIMAAAYRLGVVDTMPSQQSVRNYLNAAAKLGLIAKPSRQMYGMPTAEEPTSDAGTPEVDPLLAI